MPILITLPNNKQSSLASLVAPYFAPLAEAQRSTKPGKKRARRTEDVTAGSGYSWAA